MQESGKKSGESSSVIGKESKRAKEPKESMFFGIIFSIPYNANSCKPLQNYKNLYFQAGEKINTKTREETRNKRRNIQEKLETKEKQKKNHEKENKVHNNHR